MQTGYVYIITNPEFKGWVKVGITENLEKRLSVYQTCDPFRRYKLEYSVSHPHYKKAEKKIKEVMDRFALETKGEWYRVDLNMAKSRLNEELERYMNGE